MNVPIDAIFRAAIEPPALAQRLARAKHAYTARQFAHTDAVRLLDGAALQPRAGDLLLARIDKVGKHAMLESAEGRRSTLFCGDEIVVAYAPRYAPDQYEAHVPAGLGPCQLVASGGVAAQVQSRHVAIAAATDITPLGLLADAHGERLNLSRRALPKRPYGGARPVTIASVGTSMNAGKTTSAAHLIRGLERGGLKVGAAKITGTGSGNDRWLMRDAGAHLVLDFTDAGHASTYLLELPALIEVMQRLLSNLAAARVDAIVIEVADGLFQRETELLLRAPAFADAVDAMLFSSSDAMGAAAGVRWLRHCALPLLAVAGTLTKSPLARREAEIATRLPVLTLDELHDPATARSLLERAGTAQARGVARRALAAGPAAAMLQRGAP
jgi:hypothetical protein